MGAFLPFPSAPFLHSISPLFSAPQSDPPSPANEFMGTLLASPLAGERYLHPPETRLLGSKYIKMRLRPDLVATNVLLNSSFYFFTFHFARGRLNVQNAPLVTALIG